MKTIGISIKPEEERAIELARELHDWLVKQGKKVVLAGCLEGLELGSCTPLEDMANRVDLMVVLGGDGSLLHVARRFIGSTAPILGINLGRLGFLTEAPVGDMFEAVSRAMAGKGRKVKIFSLKAETWRGEERLIEGHAINDVVLQRNEHPRMIEFEMFIKKKFVFRLRADGLVLATPAGSTAYALSAGGPIVHPDLDAISVVPISPHTLSNRPIVVPAKDSIELRLTESPMPAALNLDGQEHLELLCGDRVRVTRDGKVSLIFLPGRYYYQMLRSKLHWGGRATEVDAD